MAIVVPCGKPGSGAILIQQCAPKERRDGGTGGSWCLQFSLRLPGVDTPFVQCFELVEYEKAFGQIVAENRELAMSEILPATELVLFCRPFESFYRFSN